MKKFLFLLLAVTAIHSLNAQNVGIGTIRPDTSAMLDISSDAKGILIPRMASVQRNRIISPATGLLVFDTTVKAFMFYNGSAWTTIDNGPGTMGTEGANDWNLVGNDIYNTNSGNVGIGTTEPLNKLHIIGNLVVNPPTMTTSTQPTANQTTSITPGQTKSCGPGDSTIRFYDPGGPSGNYSGNQTGNIEMPSVTGAIGVEIIVEAMQLGTGDSLIIKETSSPSSPYLVAVGNGYTTTGKWVINTSQVHIIFKSNGDGINGSGFSLLCRRLYDFSSSLPSISGISSRTLFFDAKNGALRSGKIDNSPRGIHSVAFGTNTTATGISSLAIGSGTNASGWNSIAAGNGSTASGDGSVSFGSYSVAEGDASFAMGYSATASGNSSMAFGPGTTASGYNSVAFGNSTIASGLFSFAAGNGTIASSYYATAFGIGTNSRGFAGTVVGMYNNLVLADPQTSVNDATPLFIIGNGDNNSTLSNAMIVRKDGKVGIGTDVPRTRLHIKNGVDASFSGSSGYFLIGDVNSTNLVFDNNEILARNTGGTSTLYLQNSGGALEIGGSAAKPGGGSWSATSDARLKQNIKPYSDGLQQLLKINPVYYQYNSLSGYDTKKQYIGVLAQNIKEVAPYMVGTFTKDNTEYLNVDNSSMTYMLINAVKELNKNNDELKNQNTELKTRLEKLESLVLKKQ